MKNKEKRIFCILIAIFTCFLCLMFSGCETESVKVSFVRFSWGERQNDYYLDFTVKFENNTNHATVIDESDFYIEINAQQENVGSILYEYQDVFYLQPIVEAKETLILRVRVISQLKKREWNTILVKYNNSVLVDDSIFI